MKRKRRRYTFMMEYLGGTYVRQGFGESPDQALAAWLRSAVDGEFEWSDERDLLLEQLAEHSAVAVEGCEGVWCVCGAIRDELFLIHIVESGSGSGEGKAVAEAELGASEARQWGWGDRR
jgi:hypothetical protein